MVVMDQLDYNPIISYSLKAFPSLGSVQYFKTESFFLAFSADSENLTMNEELVGFMFKFPWSISRVPRAF